MRISILFLAVFLHVAAFSQEKSTTDTTLRSSSLDEVVVIGSRGGARSKMESPVPVDVIRISNMIMNSGRMDLTANLNFSAPSFNFNRQSGTDGADHVNIGTLRGLGPDHTLVLINGKRRHSTALVAIFGTRGRAQSGVDLNSFPQMAVDRIEILRDGASAQYGSDAIGGVMNILLKEGPSNWTISTGIAGYADRKFNTYYQRANNHYLHSNPIDGVASNFSINKGFALGKKGGSINASMEYNTLGKTFRQVQSTDIKDPEGLPLINTIRQAFGDGSMQSFGAMYNLQLPLKKGMRFYSFGSYTTKSSQAYAFTRNWKSSPHRFPRNTDGSLIFVPDIMFKSGSDDTSYNPQIHTAIQDIAVVAGLSGQTAKGWQWDFSNAVGHNRFNYFGYKTFNASIVGNANKTSFDDGGFSFLQNTLHLDVSKEFGQKNKGGYKLSFGSELRYERYQIFKGEEGSYKAYPNSSGLEQTPGSQGFPGFSPADERTANRTVAGLYGDIEYTPNKRLLLSGAVRFENYSDFGAVATVKAAARYKLADQFNLRGSFSTGYRAPSLQQKYFSNTLTSFSSGVLVQSRIANNDDELTRLAGIPSLKQETSVNGSIGFSWRPTANLSFTVDAYQIQLKNRVVLSGLFSAEDANLPVALTNRLKSLGVVTAQFFSNAVNTTNKGLDVVATYQTAPQRKHQFRATVVANFQQAVIDQINVPSALQNTKYATDPYYTSRAKYFSNELPSAFFSTREAYFMKASAPRSKYIASLQYTRNTLSVGARFTYFGKIELTGFGDPDYDGVYPMVPADDPSNAPNALNFNDGIYVPEVFIYSGKMTTDLYANIQLKKGLNWSLGVDNLFNVHPDLSVNPLAKYWAGDNETGGPWEGVQMGYNGMRIFTKLLLNF